MKKDFDMGFLAGLLTAGLVMTLGVTALAAGRTITIDDGIRITFNGAAFTPKDAKGNTVELFTYNGTTYAPLRAICEAAGLEVGYDSATRTAQVSTSSAPAGTTANTGNYITAERAKEIALNHANVKAADATFVKAELDWENGRAEYEVEFYSGNTEYDYDIDAVTGEIRSYDRDIENWQIPAGNSGTTGTSGLLTAQRAQEIALGRAPSGASVVKCKLDWEDGRQVYELELRLGATEYECELDAASGTILSWEVD